MVTNSHGNHSDSSFQAQLLMLKDGPGPVLQLWLILGSLQHLSNTLCTCVNVYDLENQSEFLLLARQNSDCYSRL